MDVVREVGQEEELQAVTSVKQTGHQEEILGTQPQFQAQDVQPCNQRM